MPYFDSSIRNKTITIMKATIQDYPNEINSIVSFAKSIDYNIENGVDELMRLWLEDGRKAYVTIMNDKPKSIRILKQMTK